MNEVLRNVINAKLLPLRNNTTPPSVELREPTKRMRALAVRVQRARKELDACERQLKTLGVEVGKAGGVSYRYEEVRRRQSRWQRTREQRIATIQALLLQAQVDLIGKGPAVVQAYIRGLQKQLRAV